MPTYKCDRCGYSTVQIQNFRYHINRKNECQDKFHSNMSIDDVRRKLDRLQEANKSCEHCGITYRGRDHRWYHKRHCAKRPSSSTGETNASEDVPPLGTTQITQPGVSIYGCNNTVIVNNSTEHITNNITINLNPFGFEDISYLANDTPNFISKVFECIKYGEHGLADLMKLKHFHPDHPENHNIRIHDKHNSEVWNGVTWRSKPSNSVFMAATKYLENTVRYAIVLGLQDMEDTQKKIIETFMKTVGDPIGFDFGTELDVGEAILKNVESSITKQMLEKRYATVRKMYLQTMYNTLKDAQSNLAK